MKTGAHRGGLAEIPAESNEPDTRELIAQLHQPAPGPVGASIVYEQDLIGFAEAGQRAEQFPAQGLDTVLFIVDRNDDRNIHTPILGVFLRGLEEYSTRTGGPKISPLD